VVNITQGAAVAFLKLIVCRFGVPSRIITDNGTQFTSRILQEYCEGIGTQLCFAFVAHPRSNGQVERANVEILRGLKTCTYDCLKKHGANWVSELPSVLWGNRTTPSRATGETPFFLVYGFLKKHGANWVRELPLVLWGNRITPSRATGETPFFLVYGAKACLPLEIIMGSP
jgi:transposase InsO family protein